MISNSLRYACIVLAIIVFTPFDAFTQDGRIDRAYSIRRAEIEKRAGELGIPMLMHREDGMAELQGFTRRGKPLYYTTFNAVAASSISSDKVYPGGGAGLSLSGAGITLGEWDGGGVLTTHQELLGRVTQMDSPTGTSAHATHVAGTLIASGVHASARGMAYGANLHAWDWNNDTTEMKAAAANGLLVSNHSYGFITGWYNSGGTWFWFGDVTLSTVEDASFGYYSPATWSWDNTARTNPYYLIVKSAGNDRGQGPAPGTGHYYWEPSVGNWQWSTAIRNRDGNAFGYDCITDVGVAKNILTVGAVDDILGGYVNPSSVLMSSFSGWGPTDDGRIKPDVVANGIGLYSSVNSSATSYASYSGTSMSSPNVSGSIGLLLEHQNNLHPNQQLRASTMKALVIHSADEAGASPGPDYEHGWGLMNTMKAAQVMSAHAALGSPGHIFEIGISNNGSYNFDVESDGSPLRVTICWTDPAPAVRPLALNDATSRLVNDIDLRILGPSSTTMFPYVLDPANPANSATTGDNFRDNVEMVHIDAPVNGAVYTVQVTHKGTLTDAPQIVSIVVTGNVPLSAGNQPPVADAGPDITFDCASPTGSMIRLDASASFDPDNDALHYTWREGSTIIAGPTTNPFANVTFTPGVYIITLTVDDGRGGTDTDDVVVTMNEDVTPPSIDAPANLTLGNDVGFCGRSLVNTALGVPTTSDDCGVASVTNDAPAFFPVGTTLVTWTAFDGAGNSSSASQTVTITDTQDPYIAAPVDIVVSTETNQCSRSLASTVLGTPVTSDNCGVASVTHNAPASFPRGATSVTWTVYDVNGRSSSAVQKVTVVDTQPPSITAPTAISVNNDPGLCGTSANNIALGAPLVTDNCPGVIYYNDAPAFFPVGQTTVTWTARDVDFNTSTATQVITVIDVQPPVVTAPSDKVYSNDPGTCGKSATGVSLGSASASDNCGVLTLSNDAPTTFPVGTTTVTWKATDAQGNFATATQLVTINDTEKPTIHAPPTITVNTDPTSCYRSAPTQLGMPYTSDNCAVVAIWNDAPSAYPKGTTLVTWTARDASGNQSTATQQVIVKDMTPPTISVALFPEYLAPADHSMRSIRAGVMVNDNCPGSTFVLTSVTSNEPDSGTGPNDLPNDIQAVLNMPTTSFALRAERAPMSFGRRYTITYTAIDASGNRRSTSRFVYVPMNAKAVVSDETSTLPTDVTLEQNYPNPFSSYTSLVFRLPSEQTVSLRVYDAFGREVAVLTEGMFAGGSHAVVFEANELPDGVYFARLILGESVLQTKMLLLRP